MYAPGIVGPVGLWGNAMRGLRLVLPVLLAALPLSAFAGQYSLDAVGEQGASVTMTVSFAGDGETAETQTDLTFSTEFLTITAPESVNGSICLQISPSRLRIIPPSGGTTPLPAEPTPYCRYQVSIASEAPQGLIPFSNLQTLCYTPMAQTRPCTLATNSGVFVGSPVPRTLSYDPVAGSLIEFQVGNVVGGSAPNRSIVVTSSGNFGEAGISSCAISGSGAASFSVTPTSLSFPGPQHAALSVGCTYSAAEAQATLSCIEVDGDTPAPGQSRQFALRCPGVVPPANVAPTIHSSPVSGTTITIRGADGGHGTRYVHLSNHGGSGNASTTVTCYAAGSAQISRHQELPFSQGPLEQVVVGAGSVHGFYIRVPINGTPPAPVGWVSCTVTDQPLITFAIVSTNLPPPPFTSPPPPGGGGAGGGVAAPVTVPALGFENLLGLLLLFGLSGVVSLARRR